MLKKMLVIFLSSLIVISLFVFNSSPVFNNFADEYEVYLTDFSCSNQIIKADKHNYPFILNVKGESAVLKKEDFNLQSFLNTFSAKLVLEESDENYSCYYAYSPNIKSAKKVKDKTVNLHIAITDDCVKVGSPIIFGSF